MAKRAIITAEIIEQLRADRRNGLTCREIAAKYGLSVGAVSHHTIGYGPPPSLHTAIDPVAAQKEREERRSQREEHIRAVRELAFRDFLSGLVERHVRPMPPATLCQPTPTGHNRKREVITRDALLVFNDWHFEERVRPAGVLGLNQYDVATACRRVWRIVHAVRDWKRDAESGRLVVPRLTVALLGDFLTGTLHGLERHADAPNIVRAALACGDLLALALRDLAEVFASIQVVGVVGNHGRLPDDRKMPTKDPTRSWDYLAYSIARRRLAGQPNIEWHLPEAYGALFVIGGHQSFISHGNFIPNSLGIVGYGVRRFTAALASNLQAAGKPLKYAFFGHWHSSNSSEFAGVETHVCPSLIGTQEYSFLSGGAVNRSAQELFLFDEQLGLTTQERVYGDGPGYDGTYEVEV